jgi:4-hydroxy-3-polyprenylbenzoate decarboxylase
MKPVSLAKPDRLIVGITGASGASVSIRLLEHTRLLPIEIHLVISAAARLTIQQETDWQVEDVQALADISYEPDHIGAAIASGSFRTLGMVIVPCSIKTLSAVANAYPHDLIARAADVTLKEGRPLILAVRETPFSRAHLRLMALAGENGAVIFPLIPAFYNRPQTVAELVDQLAVRILARMGFTHPDLLEWNGLET